MATTPVDRRLVDAEPDPDAQTSTWRAVELGTQLATDLRDHEPRAARRAAETAFAALQELDPRDWNEAAIRCLHLVGQLRYRSGAVSDATSVLLHAVELTTGEATPIVVDPLLVHGLHTGLADVYSNLGLYSFALAEAYAALRIAEDLDDATALAWTWGDIAQVQLNLGSPTDAIQAASQAIRCGQREGADPARLAVAHMKGVVAATRLDRFLEAERHARSAEQLSTHLRPADQAELLIATGELAMRRGDTIRAEADFAAALAAVEHRGEPLQEFGALCGQAAARLAGGDPGSARDLATRALALGDSSAAFTLLSERIMAKALEQVGDLEGALEWRKKAHRSDRRLLRAHGDERLRILDLEHRANLAERNAELDRRRAERAEADRRASAARYQAMIEESADLVSVMDHDSTIRWVSSACEGILGLSPRDVLGHKPTELLQHDDLDSVGGAFLQAVEHPGIPSTPVEYRVRHGNGSWRHLSAVITDLRHDPGVNGLMLVATDVTALRQNQALIAAQASLLDLIAKDAPVTLVLNGVADVLNELFNPILECRVVWPRPGQPVAGRPPANPQVAHHPLSDAEGRLVATLACTTPIGSAAESLDRSIVEQLVQLAQLAVERSTSAEAMAHQATHDPLTGLPNRALFQELTDAALATGRVTGDAVAVLFCDLDRFKLVNDSLGHAVGDELLRQVTERIRECLSPGDVASRFGGDEFTVLRPAVFDRTGLPNLAARLISSLRRPFLIDSVELCISVSVGVTISGEGHGDSSMLISEADSAMFRAKDRGRDCFEVFDAGMQVEAEERLSRGSALRHAASRGELRLEYQPIVDLLVGQVVGHEALLRWDSPLHGAVDTADFITLAEETGLIVGIGNWVIHEALSAVAQQADPLPIWLNLSTNQLCHPSLVPSVRAALAATGADPRLLCFEITETALGSDLATAVERLKTLRSLGAKVAIDDFGTGYSSLDRLQSLPIEVLKIDRSFVSGVNGSPRRRALLGAIGDLSRSLGMASVAEGVETSAELHCLLDAGCNMAQGYLFGRPSAEIGTERSVDLDALLRG